MLAPLRDRQARARWALTALLAAAFLLGGSARGDAWSLIVLRPLAALLAGFGCWQLEWRRVRGHRFVAIMAAAIIALVLIQLVPLPFAVWSQLPGREQVVQIDLIAGLGQIARPFSLVPEATLNAALSLLVPLAALVLGMQLDLAGRAAVLPVVLGLTGLSALMGLLQVLGDAGNALYLYDITNPAAAVGLFANRNHQALLLAAALPMTALWATCGGGTVRLTAGVVMVLGLIPLILITGSRAGAAAGLAALLSLPLVMARAPLRDTSLPGRLGGLRAAPAARYAIGAALVLAIAAVTIALGRAEAWERLQTAFQGEDLRFRIMPTLIQMFPEYWPVGPGVGSFEKIFQAREPDALLSPVFMNHAHNDWIEAALTGGLPGILLIGAAVVATATCSFKRFASRAGRAAPDHLGRLGLIVICLIAMGSLTDYPLRTPLMQVVFVMAILWASCSMVQYETMTATVGNRVERGRG